MRKREARLNNKLYYITGVITLESNKLFERTSEGLKKYFSLSLSLSQERGKINVLLSVEEVQIFTPNMYSHICVCERVRARMNSSRTIGANPIHPR